MENSTSLEENMEKILKLLNLSNHCQGLELESGVSRAYFFKTAERKRSSHIRKILDSSLPMHMIDNYQLVPDTREKSLESIKFFESNPKWAKFLYPLTLQDYDGEDLTIFEKKENWYEWKVQVYKMIYDESGEVRTPGDRSIVVTVDKEGNKGKSKFVKYLCYHDLDRFSKISFGTYAQLRTALIGGGRKDVFILDFPRTRARDDSVNDILATIEDLKGGYITSNMYGKNNVLFQRPPLIILLTNDHLPYDKLSKDRWEVYVMTQAKPYNLDKLSMTKYYKKF